MRLLQVSLSDPLSECGTVCRGVRLDGVVQHELSQISQSVLGREMPLWVGSERVRLLLLLLLAAPSYCTEMLTEIDNKLLTPPCLWCLVLIGNSEKSEFFKNIEIFQLRLNFLFGKLYSENNYERLQFKFKWGDLRGPVSPGNRAAGLLYHFSTDCRHQQKLNLPRLSLLFSRVSPQAIGSTDLHYCIVAASHNIWYC